MKGAKSPLNNNIILRHSRNLLAGTNMVEVLIINDPSRTQFFKLLYSANKWLDELIASSLDIVYAASGYFQNTQFAASFGTIELHVKEIQNWGDFNGNRASAKFTESCSITNNYFILILVIFY